MSKQLEERLFALCKRLEAVAINLRELTTSLDVETLGIQLLSISEAARLDIRQMRRKLDKFQTDQHRKETARHRVVDARLSNIEKVLAGGKPEIQVPVDSMTRDEMFRRMNKITAHQKGREKLRDRKVNERLDNIERLLTQLLLKK